MDWTSYKIMKKEEEIWQMSIVVKDNNDHVIHTEDRAKTDMKTHDSEMQNKLTKKIIKYTIVLTRRCYKSSKTMAFNDWQL
jgi:hypothetical protein